MKTPSNIKAIGGLALIAALATNLALLILAWPLAAADLEGKRPAPGSTGGPVPPAEQIQFTNPAAADTAAGLDVKKPVGAVVGG